MIKPINHRKREERECELQESIFPSILHQISTSNAPWVQKWELSTLESRETRERGCLDSQLYWNLNSDAYIREEQVYI